MDVEGFFLQCTISITICQLKRDEQSVLTPKQVAQTICNENMNSPSACEMRVLLLQGNGQGQDTGTGQRSALLHTDHCPGVPPMPEVRSSFQCAAILARHLSLLCKCHLSYSLKQGIITGCPLRLLWNKNCICCVH